jgi:hypothetical protein
VNRTPVRLTRRTIVRTTVRLLHRAPTRQALAQGKGPFLSYASLFRRRLPEPRGQRRGEVGVRAAPAPVRPLGRAVKCRT